MRFAVLVGVLATACTVSVSARAADVHDRPRHSAARPSADAIELSVLAPPTNLSTVEQTYGDAAYARARMQRRAARAEAMAHADPQPVPFGIDPCEPHAAGSAGYSCHNEAAHAGYGAYYAYMPAAASAPQVPRYDSSAQSPILAPATAFFQAVNAARFDQHN